MGSWTVMVQSLDKGGTQEKRFVVWLFDPRGPDIRGPDGGENYAGYTEAEVRLTLANSYTLPGEAIDSLIQNAKSNSATTVRD